MFAKFIINDTGQLHMNIGPMSIYWKKEKQQHCSDLNKCLDFSISNWIGFLNSEVVENQFLIGILEASCNSRNWDNVYTVFGNDQRMKSELATQFVVRAQPVFVFESTLGLSNFSLFFVIRKIIINKCWDQSRSVWIQKILGAYYFIFILMIRKKILLN